MEGIREIARSYYERATVDEKNSFRDFFNKLGVNGDGKISLPEFKKSVSSWLLADSVFDKLDANGDGVLDFDEVLSLYYMEKKVNLVRCNGCWDLLVGPYFSCLLCFGKSSATYDLCCGCHRGGEAVHDHSSTYMLDHHSLIQVLKDRASADARKTKEKKEMEELREIARAHYRAGSPEVQSLAYEFYRSMDTDGDGKVDLAEFLAFMRQEGYSRMRNTYFFDELDLDSNGTLDFSEVMTLYYIIRSQRPFCDSCAKFIPGIFFSCVECFNANRENSFHACLDCYRSKKFSHSHDGPAQFLDNYTLLHAKRDSGFATPTGASTSEPWKTSPSYAIVPMQHTYINTSYPTYNNTYAAHPPNAGPNYCNAIVPVSDKWSKWRLALTALEVALSIGTFCTIM